MQLAEQHSCSEAAYLACEEALPIRHEYVWDEAYAISGGTFRHNRIALNTASLLRARLLEKPRQVFMSDVKLHAARGSANFYPDEMVTCAEQASAANKSQVVNGPATWWNSPLSA